MKTILLTQGKETIIDDEDFESVNQYKWFFHTRYAMRMLPRNGKPQKTLRLHNFLMNPPIGMVVDHINGNSLDNRRSNLRICKIQENNKNVKKPRNNTSGFKGVSWHKRDQIWQAYLTTKKKHFSLGYFENKKEAAMAYNIKAKELYGEFANLNKP